MLLGNLLLLQMAKYWALILASGHPGEVHVDVKNVVQKRDE